MTDTIKEQPVDIRLARRYGRRAAQEGRSIFDNPFHRRINAEAYIDAYLEEVAKSNGKS